MKNKLILTCLLLVANGVSAIPILSLQKSCKGLWGYDEVNFDRQIYDYDEDGSPMYGWVAECHGRGLSACRAPRNGIAVNEDSGAQEADNYDLDVAQEMIRSLTSGELNSGSGQLSEKHQVEGQSFQRVYTIVWYTEPTICYDEQGDPYESVTEYYTVEVEYITL